MPSAEPGDGDGIAQSFRRRRLASQRAAGEAAARARHPGGQATFFSLLVYLFVSLFVVL